MSDDDDPVFPPNPLAVYCEDCLNVHDGTRREHPNRWLCMRAKREAYPAYTVRGAIQGEPYFRCHQINRNGECEMFAPRPRKGKPDENV
jgi:hypothetical protein